jgi:formamidopyrimidine-DNA glycosylase
MPELPEVQAHAERLAGRYRGVALAAFRPMKFTVLKTAAPSPAEAVGQPLTDVGRRGKFLLARFGSVTFAIHLMQGGRLKEEPKGKQPATPRGGQARWVFEDGRAWLLTEQGTERRAGVWVFADDAVLTRPPLSELGPEPLGLPAAALAERFAAQPARLHGFLRDQHAIAGLGRRLANEVCWRARLSPPPSPRRSRRGWPTSGPATT